MTKNHDKNQKKTENILRNLKINQEKHYVISFQQVLTVLNIKI